MDTYHVVCHECPEEAILDEQTATESTVADHREETGSPDERRLVFRSRR